MSEADVEMVDKKPPQRTTTLKGTTEMNDEMRRTIRNLSPEDMRQMFDMLDTDSGGTLDKAELRDAFQLLKLAPNEELDEAVEKALRAMDQDGNQEVDFDEFKTMVEKVNSRSSISKKGGDSEEIILRLVQGTNDVMQRLEERNQFIKDAKVSKPTPETVALAHILIPKGDIETSTLEECVEKRCTHVYNKLILDMDILRVFMNCYAEVQTDNLLSFVHGMGMYHWSINIDAVIEDAMHIFAKAAHRYAHDFAEDIDKPIDMDFIHSLRDALCIHAVEISLEEVREIWCHELQGIREPNTLYQADDEEDEDEAEDPYPVPHDCKGKCGYYLSCTCIDNCLRKRVFPRLMFCSNKVGEMEEKMPLLFALLGLILQTVALVFDWLAQMELQDSCLTDNIDLQPFITAQFIFCITASCAWLLTILLLVYDCMGYVRDQCCDPDKQALYTFHEGLKSHSLWTGVAAFVLQDYPQFWILLIIMVQQGFRRNDYESTVAFFAALVGLYWFASRIITAALVLMKHTARKLHRAQTKFRKMNRKGALTQFTSLDESVNLIQRGMNTSSSTDDMELSPEPTSSNLNLASTLSAADSPSTSKKTPRSITERFPMERGFTKMFQIMSKKDGRGWRVSLLSVFFVLILPVLLLSMCIPRVISHNRPLVAGRLDVQLYACPLTKACHNTSMVDTSTFDFPSSPDDCPNGVIPVSHHTRPQYPWIKPVLALEPMRLRRSYTDMTLSEIQDPTVSDSDVPYSFEWSTDEWYIGFTSMRKWPDGDMYVKAKQSYVHVTGETRVCVWSQCIPHPEDTSINHRITYIEPFSNMEIMNHTGTSVGWTSVPNLVMWPLYRQANATGYVDCTAYLLKYSFVSDDCVNSPYEVKYEKNDDLMTFIHVIGIIVYLTVVIYGLEPSDDDLFEPRIHPMLWMAIMLSITYALILSWYDVVWAFGYISLKGQLVLLFNFLVNAYMWWNIKRTAEHGLRMWYLFATLKGNICEKRLIKFVNYLPGLLALSFFAASFFVNYEEY